jgi:putative PIN family toxin of toxin-antitoxin system
MKIVLDTNVLVSGLLKAHSDAGTIVRQVVWGGLKVVYDARIIVEYRDVLSRPKFGFDPATVGAIISQVEADGILASAMPLPDRLPDPDDEPFLEAALAAQATVLVTGNKKHFPASGAEYPLILSPSEFVSYWREKV